VVSDQRFFRPSDIDWSQGNPERASKRLGWEAKTRMPELVKLMLDAAGKGLDLTPPDKKTGAT
jgi:GDPmannose 4,6-dehydratase